MRPTLEIVLIESPAHLRKRYDPESGIALIALDEPAPAGPSQGETSLPRVPDEEADVVGPQAQRILEEKATTPRSSTEEGAGLEP